MADARPWTERPIRVVMFGSGPVLTPDARRFLSRLDAEPDIDLVGAFCQADGSSLSAVARDLVRRRGVLAVPLFALFLARGAAALVRHPRATLAERRAFARLEGRVHMVADIHAASTLRHVESLSPDLGLVYGSPILKPELFEIPTLGTLGIHHGKVPEYRGNKTTFWAMQAGEPKAGVTIQKINAGLDTGEIVSEGSVEIGRRSLGTVWRDLEALGLDLYIQAILDVKAGRATYRAQTGEKGRLYKNPKLGDLLRFHASWLVGRLR